MMSRHAWWEDISPEVVITGDVCPFAYMATPWSPTTRTSAHHRTSIFINAMDGCLEELDTPTANLQLGDRGRQVQVFIDDSMVSIDPRTGKDQLDPLEH